MSHHARLTFVFLVETGFLHIGQAGLELPTSGDLPASASQGARITEVSYHARPSYILFVYFKLLKFLSRNIASFVVISHKLSRWC